MSKLCAVKTTCGKNPRRYLDPCSVPFDCDWSEFSVKALTETKEFQTHLPPPPPVPLPPPPPPFLPNRKLSTSKQLGQKNLSPLREQPPVPRGPNSTVALPQSTTSRLSPNPSSTLSKGIGSPLSSRTSRTGSGYQPQPPSPPSQSSSFHVHLAPKPEKFQGAVNCNSESTIFGPTLDEMKTNSIVLSADSLGFINDPREFETSNVHRSSSTAAIEVNASDKGERFSSGDAQNHVENSSVEFNYPPYHTSSQKTIADESDAMTGAEPIQSQTDEEYLRYETHKSDKIELGDRKGWSTDCVQEPYTDSRKTESNKSTSAVNNNGSEGDAQNGPVDLEEWLRTEYLTLSREVCKLSLNTNEATQSAIDCSMLEARRYVLNRLAELMEKKQMVEAEYKGKTKRPEAYGDYNG